MQLSVEYTLEDQERMSRARRYFAWQSDLACRELGNRVVEVGCGVGNFTERLLDREQVYALDIEQACVDRLRKRFPGRDNVRAFAMSVTDPGFLELVQYRPDSCVCLNVLEHVRDDLQALRNMAGVLGAGGRIVLIVPAFPALYGPIDRNLGHYRRYTRGGLRTLAGEAGLEVVRLKYVNTVGFFGWWANAHFFKREAQSAAQIGFFDDFIVPVLSRVEAVFPPPFGQSILVVLSKMAT